MEIRISELADRFKIFSYSTFQKYKLDKCDNKEYFNCKKDFYNYLEDMYYFEYLSRKKLLKHFSDEDFVILSWLDFEECNKDNFMECLLHKLLAKQKISYFYKNTIHSMESNSIQNFYLRILNAYLFSKENDNWNIFDEYTFFQILKNLKRYNIKNDYFSNFVDFSKIKEGYLEIKSDYVFRRFFITKKNSEIQLYEIEEINSKETLKPLKEPKWIFNKTEDYIIYLDHRFNFLKIDYNENKLLFNGISILNLNDIISKLDRDKKKEKVKILKMKHL